MIIRKNILKTIVTVFLIVVIFATLYINKFLAPTWLKGFLIKSVSQAVDRPVSLASVRLNPLRGFIIEGLTLYEPDGKTEFLRIERLTTSILLIPLINEHKILIPSVRIFKPSVRIVKKADNSWNFAAPPLLKKAQPASDDTKGFTLLIQNIAIENGRIDFTDNTRAPAYNKALIGLDATAVYSAKENAVRFKAASKVTEPLKTSIGLEGAYLIKENSLITKTVIKNLPILELYNYFYKLSLIANLKSGDANAVIDIKTETGKKIGISYDASIKNLDISYYDLNLKGDLGLAGTSNLDFAEIFKQEHKAAFNLKGSTLKGLYFFNEISDVTGTIEISKDGISTAGLEGIAHNVPIKFIGGIKNMDDPQFRGSLHIAKT
ncbi:MAG: AsmA family protein, partial [Candidatus Omnitrophica bacterium]|nr:AsmA family protein [Candidatus Omnitrophota bacterium]